MPISITSKPQALALVGEWLREYRSVLGSRSSVLGSKSIGFQLAGPKPINGFPKIVVTPNPEMIVAAQTDPEFLKALQSADLAIPDGIGIVWALKLLGSRFSVLGSRLQVNRFSVSWFQTDKPKTDKPETENRKPKTDNRFPSRLSGLDLMESMIRESAKHGWRVMLVGGKPGVADRVAERLQLSVLGYQLSDSSQSVVSLPVAETEKLKTGKPETENRKQKTDNRLQIKSINGPPDIDKANPAQLNSLISSINSYSPDLLFVAFGHGKQEKWLTKNRHRLNAGVAMGVGGALDQIADPSLRPPAYINSIGLGWLYRLVRQPWRIKRQLTLLKFIWMVVKAKQLQFAS